jgi:hypothetical protein
VSPCSKRQEVDDGVTLYEPIVFGDTDGEPILSVYELYDGRGNAASNHYHVFVTISLILHPPR